MGKNREIFKYEIKKIVKSPIVIAVFIVFLVFDLTLVFRNYGIKDDLKVLNNIIDEVGYKIDEPMMGEFKIYYEKNLKEATELIKKVEGKNVSSISEYFKGKEPGIYLGKYSKKEEKILKDTAIIEEYYLSVPELKKAYEKIDYLAMVEPSIKSIEASGDVAETIRSGYERFNVRFTEVKENKEYMEFFFNGKYKMHRYLFGEIFGALIFQIMILIALISTFLVNYEFESGTSLVAYSTKRGRKLIYDKLKAITLVALSLSTALITVVLTMFFSIYDYSRVLQVSVSSMFNWETQLPYVSWFSLSVKEYLICLIVLIYLSIFIFIAITFVIGRFIKNSYASFVVCCILNGIGLVLPSLIPATTMGLVYSLFNPFILASSTGIRFMESGALTNFKYYEGITVIAWGILMGIAMFYAIKSFKRESIC